MTTQTLVKKIANLEVEIALIKKTASRRPDFAIDEDNWRKVRKVVKKARAKTYKNVYG